MNLGPVVWAALALCAAAEPGGVRVEGSVIEANGKPARGAEVFLSEATADWGFQPLVHGRTTVGSRNSDESHFSLALPEDPDYRYLQPRPLTLWAFQDDRAIAWHSLPRGWPELGALVVLQLGVAPAFEVQVQSPDGSPAEGVRLMPARVAGRLLPSPLAEKLAIQTDAGGKAVLKGFATEDVDILRAVSATLGTQHFAMPSSDKGGCYTLTLHRAGSVEGRITAADRRAAEQMIATLSTKADPSDEDLIGGFAETTTDADGRFRVPAIAEGALTVHFLPRMDLPFRGQFTAHPEVEAGKTTRIEMALKPGTRVRGVVREQKSGKPVSGALVQIDWAPGVPKLRTDAEGRYAGWMLSSSVTPHIPAPPRGYFFPNWILDSVPIPAGAKEVEAKPYVLAWGATLRGRVIDGAGKPVPGATVTALWKIPEGEYDSAQAWADRDGKFVLEGIDPRAELRLTAWDWDAGTCSPQTVRPGGAESVTLTITPADTVAVSGRVLDAGGKPLAGAVVHLRSGLRSSRGLGMFERLVALGERDKIRTDSAGRFQTPRRLPPEYEYQAEVEAPDRIGRRTEWLTPARGKTATFADVVLAPTPQLRTVTGRLVDRTGKPISGADVFQSGDGPHRTRTTTDEQGRFRLPGVFEGRAFLFVEGPGLTLRAQSIEVTGKPVELTVDRQAGPDGPTGTLPPMLSRAEERALAWQVLQPLVPRVLLGNFGNLAYRLGDIGPRVNPSLALEYSERGVLGEYDYIVRMAAAEGLLDDAPEEGLAVAETLADARWRTHLYILAADRVPSSDRARKQQLLDTALLYARSDPSAVGKLDGFGMVALRWLELGERDKATRILREGQAQAATLPAPRGSNRSGEGAHARGRFAAKLARIDTKAALELADGFPDPYNEWYLNGVALGLAERDPAEAERVAGMLHYGNRRLPRLCGRMAPVDLPRARKLAARIDEPNEHIDALVAMTDALAKANPEAAATLLEEVLTTAEKMHGEGNDTLQYHSPASVVVASLLPVAERLGPDHLRRYLWQSLALRPRRPAQVNPQDRFDASATELAVLLARYDRAAARIVLEPTIRRLPLLFELSNRYTPNYAFAAATLIDPQWVVSLLELAPDRVGPGGTRPRDEARLTIAEVLSRSGASRWEYVYSRYAYVRPDSKDDER
jgi:protocatechuate 3,4-dioxygenase beta subunit